VLTLTVQPTIPLGSYTIIVTAILNDKVTPFRTNVWSRVYEFVAVEYNPGDLVAGGFVTGDS